MSVLQTRDALALRRLGPDGFNRAIRASLAVHVVVAAAIIVVPRDWFARLKPAPIYMTLDLGATEGPKTGGMNSASARRVEEVVPPTTRPTPVLPASPPKQDVIAVAPKVTSKPPAKVTETVVPNVVQRPPATGAKLNQGTAAAETGATVQSTGLTVGGGTAGSPDSLDSNFCCPAWAEELKRRIHARWEQRQQETGVTEIAFEIRRDGSFTPPIVVKSSGSVMLDASSKAAFSGLKLMALPAEYKGDSLKVRLSFEYKR